MRAQLLLLLLLAKLELKPCTVLAAGCALFSSSLRIGA